VSDEKPNLVPGPVIGKDAWNDAVGEWINSCIRGSAISQDVGAWNRLNEVLPRLRDFLNDVLSKKE
jgi:hypothetical protein